MAPVIRPLDAGDREAWQPLWLGYQAFYGVAIPEPATETTWRRLLDPAEPVFGLAAIDDGYLAGFTHYLLHRSTWMVADTCYVQDLFVAPERRGKAIASRLIEAVYGDADARGAGQVYWLTHQDNTAARRVYDRLAKNAGFVLYERFAETGGQ